MAAAVVDDGGEWDRKALPRAQHVELECGHVPQLEAPQETHAAVRRFLAARRAVRAA